MRRRSPAWSRRGRAETEQAGTADLQDFSTRQRRGPGQTTAGFRVHGVSFDARRENTAGESYGIPRRWVSTRKITKVAREVFPSSA